MRHKLPAELADPGIIPSMVEPRQMGDLAAEGYQRRMIVRKTPAHCGRHEPRHAKKGTGGVTPRPRPGDRRVAPGDQRRQQRKAREYHRAPPS